MTAYQSYRSMKWTSAADKCEECDKMTMAEGRYVEGSMGHYCSAKCRAEAEGDCLSDAQERASERKQMGL
jgi:hypothetical protein